MWFSVRLFILWLVWGVSKLVVWVWVIRFWCRVLLGLWLFWWGLFLSGMICLVMKFWVLVCKVSSLFGRVKFMVVFLGVCLLGMRWLMLFRVRFWDCWWLIGWGWFGVMFWLGFYGFVGCYGCLGEWFVLVGGVGWVRLWVFCWLRWLDVFVFGFWLEFLGGFCGLWWLWYWWLLGLGNVVCWVVLVVVVLEVLSEWCWVVYGYWVGLWCFGFGYV